MPLAHLKHLNNKPLESVCLSVCLSFMDDQTVGPIDHKLGVGIDGELVVEIG